MQTLPFSITLWHKYRTTFAQHRFKHHVNDTSKGKENIDRIQKALYDSYQVKT